MYEVCGYVFLGISIIRDLTLVYFVELRRRYAGLSSRDWDVAYV